MTAEIVIIISFVLVFSASTTSPKLNTALLTASTLVSKLPEMSTNPSNLNSTTLLSTILLHVTPTETVVSESYSTKFGSPQENTSVSTYPHSNVITTTRGSISKSNESTVNKTEVTMTTHRLMPEYNNSHPAEHDFTTVSKLYSLFTTRTYNSTTPVITSGTQTKQTDSLVNYTSAKATFMSTSNASALLSLTSSRTSSGIHQTVDTNTPLPVTIYSHPSEHGHSTIARGTSISAGQPFSTASPSASPSVVGVTTPLTEGTLSRTIHFTKLKLLWNVLPPSVLFATFIA